MRAVWLLLFALLGAPALAETKRIAVVVGNNAGTGAQPPLRYAESDAGKVSRLLVELGDVLPEDLMLLQGRTLREVEGAISFAASRVEQLHATPDTRVVLLFYFSGHSDGEALELGKERLGFAQLKSWLAGAKADVRVSIIDACKSGSALRPKGGKPAPAFTIKLTDQLASKGEVFITSSAADELALESSEVMGSLFTHNLLSGLRGAADVSGDKLVTLSEAYRYAYDRTVSTTAQLPVGTQHPSYDYRLSGQGELVLTTLHVARTRLILPGDAERVVVTDLARDQVVAELPQVAARELALPAGRYGLKLTRGGQVFGGRAQLPENGRVEVRWTELTPVRSSPTRLVEKGGEVAGELQPMREGPSVSVSVGGARAVASEVEWVGQLRAGVELGEERGFTVAALGATGRSGDGVVRESNAQLRGGYRWSWSNRWVGGFVGLEAGPAYVWQTASTPGGAPVHDTALTVSAGPRLGGRLHLLGPAWATLELEAPVYPVFLDDGTGRRFTAVPLPAGSLGLVLAL